jgi:hypothetical protein
VKRRNKGRISGPFVPMMKDTMKTPAFKALSHGARSLLTVLRARYNTTLQNAVYISTRDASKELGSHSRRNNVMRWFRELQYYGFIRMVRPAHHGVNGHGKAPHWRLTEEGYLGKEPTRDFLRWDGTVFHEQKSPKHYQTKNRSRGSYGVATLAHPVMPVAGPKPSMNGTSGAPPVAISDQTTGSPAVAITSLTTAFSEEDAPGPTGCDLIWEQLTQLATPPVYARMVVTRARLEHLWQLRKTEPIQIKNESTLPSSCTGRITDYAVALGYAASGGKFMSSRGH